MFTFLKYNFKTLFSQEQVYRQGVNSIDLLLWTFCLICPNPITTFVILLDRRNGPPHWSKNF